MKITIVAIAHLHNYCINERLAINGSLAGTNTGYDGREWSPYMAALREEAAAIDFAKMEHNFEDGFSNNRDRMVKNIQNLRMTRPGRIVAI